MNPDIKTMKISCKNVEKTVQSINLKVSAMETRLKTLELKVDAVETHAHSPVMNSTYKNQNK
jgi:archaellum component FlaC